MFGESPYKESAVTFIFLAYICISLTANESLGYRKYVVEVLKQGHVGSNIYIEIIIIMT
jgi:hypothetical protein